MSDNYPFPLLVVEYVSRGPLDRYLRRTRPPLNVQVGMSLDIATGMLYLNSTSFVVSHLTAHAILVGRDNICKIDPMASTRNASDVSNPIGAPEIRWMAPELLSLPGAISWRKSGDSGLGESANPIEDGSKKLVGCYTDASSVWAFGVVLWEIFNQGEHPYGKWRDRKVVTDVLDGYRLPPPPACPSPIYRIMMQCWHPEPYMRPGIEPLFESVKEAGKVRVSESGTVDSTSIGVVSNHVVSNHESLLVLQNMYLKAKRSEIGSPDNKLVDVLMSPLIPEEFVLDVKCPDDSVYITIEAMSSPATYPRTNSRSKHTGFGFSDFGGDSVSGYNNDYRHHVLPFPSNELQRIATLKRQQQPQLIHANNEPRTTNEADASYMTIMPISPLPDLPDEVTSTLIKKTAMSLAMEGVEHRGTSLPCEPERDRQRKRQALLTKSYSLPESNPSPSGSPLSQRHHSYSLGGSEIALDVFRSASLPGSAPVFIPYLDAIPTAHMSAAEAAPPGRDLEVREREKSESQKKRDLPPDLAMRDAISTAGSINAGSMNGPNFTTISTSPNSNTGNFRKAAPFWKQVTKSEKSPITHPAKLSPLALWTGRKTMSDASPRPNFVPSWVTRKKAEDNLGEQRDVGLSAIEDAFHPEPDG